MIRDTSAHTARVRDMFARIASRYDRMNQLMTAGLDRNWRRRVVSIAAPAGGERVLDLGAGTGDLAREILRQAGEASVVGADLTPEMLRIGRRLSGGDRIRWLNADALNLPFPGGYFDLIVSGYLLRNVVDLDRSLREQVRVLKPGGRFVCLDTTPPPADIWHWPVRFHLRHVIPILGRLFAGDPGAYTYLPASTEGFRTAEQLAAHMRAAGFDRVGFTRLGFGSMAIHWGRL